MKKYKPTSAGRRGMTSISYKDALTISKPFKKLTRGLPKSSGRNNQGRITSRFRGGRVKRSFREIDFRFNKLDIPAKIETIEYDPNRTAFISLICYLDGDRKYILATKNLKVGDKIIISKEAELKEGNRTILKNIPVGSLIHSIELKPQGGAKICRSAGSSAEVIASEGDYVSIKLSSKEVRKIHCQCYATIGVVSNEENKLLKIGKAGRARKMGRRPRVRGSAMNAVDHPYGGGEGRAGRGRRRAVNKWGKPTGIGQKTRKAKKYSNTFIVSRRKTKR